MNGRGRVARLDPYENSPSFTLPRKVQYTIAVQDSTSGIPSAMIFSVFKDEAASNTVRFASVDRLLTTRFGDSAAPSRNTSAKMTNVLDRNAWNGRSWKIERGTFATTVGNAVWGIAIDARGIYRGAQLDLSNPYALTSADPNTSPTIREYAAQFVPNSNAITMPVATPIAKLTAKILVQNRAIAS